MPPTPFFRWSILRLPLHAAYSVGIHSICLGIIPWRCLGGPVGAKKSFTGKSFVPTLVSPAPLCPILTGRVCRAKCVRKKIPPMRPHALPSPVLQLWTRG